MQPSYAGIDDDPFVRQPDRARPVFHRRSGARHRYQFGASIGANSSGEYARAFPVGRDNSPKAVLARLNQLCASERSSDQQRCEKAWRVINQAHAELQARRAADAAAGHGVTN